MFDIYACDVNQLPAPDVVKVLPKECDMLSKLELPQVCQPPEESRLLLVVPVDPMMDDASEPPKDAEHAMVAPIGTKPDSTCEPLKEPIEIKMGEASQSPVKIELPKAALRQESCETELPQKEFPKDESLELPKAESLKVIIDGTMNQKLTTAAKVMRRKSDWRNLREYGDPFKSPLPDDPVCFCGARSLPGEPPMLRPSRESLLVQLRDAVHLMRRLPRGTSKASSTESSFWPR